MVSLNKYKLTQYSKDTFYIALKKLFRDTDFDFIKYNREYLLRLMESREKGIITPKDYAT